MKTAAARFSALSVARTSVLEKARQASRLTIPGLIPETGQNEHYSPTQPYQSAGAHGLRSLSARLLSTLFPTSVQFFRLELDAFAAAQLEADKNDVDTKLSQVAETTAAMMDDLRVRPALAEVIKQLIAAGNVVAYLPQDRAPRVYRLDQFVLKRDNYGAFTDIVIQEKVWPSTLPEDVRTALGVKIDPDKAEQQIDVYTVVEQRDGKVTHWQEIEGKIVPNSKSEAIPVDQAGWLAPRWTVVPGSDYGRSHITEYLGDLLSMEDHYKAITQFAAIASRVVTVVNPNSSVDVAELAAAESGDYLYGEAEAIQTLGLNKSQDFAVIKDVTARSAEDRPHRLCWRERRCRQRQPHQVNHLPRGGRSAMGRTAPRPRSAILDAGVRCRPRQVEQAALRQMPWHHRPACGQPRRHPDRRRR